MKFKRIRPLFLLHNRQAQIICLFASVFLLQGCAPINVGEQVISIGVYNQENAGYADYYFSIQSTNAINQNTGQSPLPILSRDEWATEVYEPRIKYVLYRDKYFKAASAHKNPIDSSLQPMTFEEWRSAQAKPKGKRVNKS